MSRVFHRRTGDSDLPLAVRGEGAYIIDDAGRRYIDASGGAAVSCLGHNDAEVRAAIAAQVDRIAYAHTAFFSNAPMEELADLLVTEAPAGMERVFFVSGGTEAVEAAVKMARQYFVEAGQPRRRRVIARRQSYHGTTLGMIAVGGNEWRRAPFEPMLMDVPHIGPCYAYRHQRPDESAEDYGRRAADELEQAILALGPDTVAAFVAETVVGASAGAVPPVTGYFRRIREICDRYGVLLILDEVMCGMGRTGTLYACEQEGVTPDLLTVAKGLGGGYQPIGAVLVSGRVYEAFETGSGSFRHGHTYMGHATACAAALAVQRAVRERNLLENVRRRGAELRAALERRFAAVPQVGDIRGRGLFLAAELVADPDTREPFDPGLNLAGRIKAQGMARGLICYPGSGTADGRRGDHVLLAPPFIIDSAQVEEIADKTAAAVTAALAEVRDAQPADAARRSA